MKEIRIKRLSLENFKGFTFTLNANGEDLSVFGENGTGKTTISDAWHWLLFNSDSQKRSNFEVKTLTPDGEAVHGLEHSVEAVILIDGREITLKKTYSENWQKKRGSAHAVFTGHSSSYWINGVPCQLKDFKDQISDLVGDESIFRLLTSPSAFPALPWMKQRETLLEVCGNVPDADVIAATPTLEPLTAILGERSLDDHKKIVVARRTEINKQLTALPIRIDEVKRGLPDIPDTSEKELSEMIGELEARISEDKLRLAGIDNGAGIAELSKKVQEIRFDINELENKYFIEGMRHVTVMNAKINELTSGKQDKDFQINKTKEAIDYNQKRIAGLEAQLQALREKWTAIDAETFQDTTEDTCPACGQALPSDRVQEARDKALGNFNQDKAERLLAIETRGKELRTELDKTIPDIERLHALLMELQAVGDDDQHDMLIAERDILKAQAEDYSQIPGRAAMLETKAELERQIEAIRAGISQDKDAIQKEINDLTAQLSLIKEQAARFTRIEQGKARIEELKTDEKKLTAEFEKLEQELYLIESFIKAKVAMLTERINGLFTITRFKLFDVQVNGGISECCEITVNGIPFDCGLNNAARINAGLDVCRTLSRHFGLVAPTFVDNAESVCELVRMDSQVIRLVVSEPDKVLRVETAKKRMAA